MEEADAPVGQAWVSGDGGSCNLPRVNLVLATGASRDPGNIRIGLWAILESGATDTALATTSR